jgi:hypothetical protein
MPWFKRKKEETYNEQLLREAGLGEAPRQPLIDPAVLGMGPRPAEWDVYSSAEASDIGGDSVSFAALPTGDLIVDDDAGDADLSPLADAVEQHLAPPYRAIGRKEEGALWSVAARRIDVRRLAVPEGDEVELVVRDGERTVSIDGEPSDVALAGLAESGDYVARGTRLDGDLWEIQVDRL